MSIKDFLRGLVAIPSISGDEEGIADYIEEKVKRLCDFPVHRVQDNVIVRVPGRNRKKCLIFNGHIDTVAPGDRAQWHTNPHELVEQGDKMFGLGVSDMKGGNAVLLHMLCGFSKTPPSCDVVIMFVSHEEVTGEGTQVSLKYLEKAIGGYEYIAAVVAEPTDLRVVLGHRGNFFVRVLFEGRGAHASTPPAAAHQAILKAQEFVNSIPGKVQSWNAVSEGNTLGNPTIAITEFKAGSGSVNQIPTQCQVVLDVRTNELLHDQLRGLLRDWAKEYGGVAELLSESPPGHCAAEEEIAIIAMDMAQQSKGDVYASSADQCFFTQAGIPAIIYGPGHHACIHAPNEYIDSAVLDVCEARFMAIIEKWSAATHTK